MKAVVMAGGEGSRLRPLTSRRPKPLVPVAGRPIMEHILLHLRRHRVRDVIATIQYLGAAIRNHFGDGSEQGVSLTYSVEDSPLGTAGSVKVAESQLRETFIVISGDALTDIDLGAAVRFHRQRQSMATIVLKAVPNPLEYGVVVADGYWEDVGSHHAYLKANFDCLEGKVAVDIPAERSGHNTWVADDADVAEDARVDGPALICSGAKVRRGAWINGPCVIGNYSTVDNNAKLSNSVLWDHAYVGE